MYSVLCAVGVFFVIFCVPETKGRDTEDIAKLFGNNKRHESIVNGNSNSVAYKVANNEEI